MCGLGCLGGRARRGRRLSLGRNDPKHQNGCQIRWITRVLDGDVDIVCFLSLTPPRVCLSSLFARRVSWHYTPAKMVPELAHGLLVACIICTDGDLYHSKGVLNSVLLLDIGSLGFGFWVFFGYGSFGLVCDLATYITAWHCHCWRQLSFFRWISLC